MKIEAFRQIVGEWEHISEAAPTFANRNQLQQRDGEIYFQGADGVKTGFTDEAGYCLVFMEYIRADTEH